LFYGLTPEIKMDWWNKHTLLLSFFLRYDICSSLQRITCPRWFVSVIAWFMWIDSSLFWGELSLWSSTAAAPPICCQSCCRKFICNRKSQLLHVWQIWSWCGAIEFIGWAEVSAVTKILYLHWFCEHFATIWRLDTRHIVIKVIHLSFLSQTFLNLMMKRICSHKCVARFDKRMTSLSVSELLTMYMRKQNNAQFLFCPEHFSSHKVITFWSLLCTKTNGKH